ncbi:MAG: folate-binding protein [Alphaproteobacteria bacterium]|nr:MAG: folate-binding protein [Alphaproteobacteria bacterium]
MPPDAYFTAQLSDRRLIRVTGEDATSFLQNVITNDMGGVSAAEMRYACLLTPQGQYLHDFFILSDGAGGYFLDVEAVRAEDLLRRFGIFRLRSRVSFSYAPDMRVYAALRPGRGYPDPRRAGLGYRIYTAEILPSEPVQRYYDFCIARGVPCGSLTIKPEKETMADVNLDLLNAVAWDKGCFIGQEVAARMHHRGLSKRRLFVVSGSGLAPGVLRLNGVDVGELRQVNGAKDMGLAVIKLAAVSDKSVELATEQGTPARLSETSV